MKLQPIRTEKLPRRNDKCPCGSGKKAKKCCLAIHQSLCRLAAIRPRANRGRQDSRPFGAAAVKRIPLTQGKEALVSDQDYKYLMQWKWYYLKANSGKGGYAARKGPRPAQRQIYMHKGVAARKGLSGEIDHHDQNKLNNQRRNLRSTNHSGNAGNCGVRTNNESGFKGVTQYKRWWAKSASTAR